MHQSNVVNRARAIALVVLFGLVASSALAQVPDSGLLNAPDLKLLSDGEVRATAYMPDGSLIVGGAFSLINGQRRRNLARVFANGEVDPDWKPEPDRSVTALDVDAAGNVYVGGFFQMFGGQAHGFMAKIPAGSAGQFDSNWPVTPGILSDPPISILVSADGTTIFTSTRRLVKKISSDGVLASEWGQQVHGDVYDIALGGDGHLYVAGYGFFPAIVPSRLLRMSVDGIGAVDTSWDPQPSDRVSALAVDSDAHALIVGGAFTEIGGQPRANLARIPFSSNGAIDPTWMPEVEGGVSRLSNVSDGQLFALVYVRSMPERPLAKLHQYDVASGTRDPDWQYDVNGVVDGMTAAPGSPLAVAGGGGREWSMNVAGVASFNLALLPPTGNSAPPSMEVGYPGNVVAMARQPDGGTIIGGVFEWAGGMPRSNLLRLKPDGTVDPLWNPGPDIGVNAIQIDAEGDVFVGGVFRSIGGQTLRGLAKVSGSGTGIVQPLPSVGSVYTLCYDGLGNLFVGGYLNAIEGQTHRGMVKVVRSITGDWNIDSLWAPQTSSASDLILDESRNLYAAFSYRVQRFSADGIGQADPDWIFQVGGFAWTLALDSSQRLYVGGDFVLGDGFAQANLVRVGTGPTAVVDTAWSPLVTSKVWDIAIGADGSVYAGGKSNRGSGAPRTLVSRFAGTGAGLVDANWDAGLFNEEETFVGSILVEPNNRVLIGGRFTIGNPANRMSFAAYGDSIFTGEFDLLPAN